MELCSMLCASLGGKGLWWRLDTCVSMVESLPCLPETTTTLLIGYTPIQNVFGVKKKIRFKKRERKKNNPNPHWFMGRGKQFTGWSGTWKEQNSKIRDQEMWWQRKTSVDSSLNVWRYYVPCLCSLQIPHSGTSLVVQWLRLQTYSAGGSGSIPGQGTKMPQAQVANFFSFF